MWSHLLKKSLLENFIFCAVFREMGETSIHTTPPVFSHSSVIPRSLAHRCNNILAGFLSNFKSEKTNDSTIQT